MNNKDNFIALLQNYNGYVLVNNTLGRVENDEIIDPYTRGILLQFSAIEKVEVNKSVPCWMGNDNDRAFIVTIDECDDLNYECEVRLISVTRIMPDVLNTDITVTKDEFPHDSSRLIPVDFFVRYFKHYGGRNGFIFSHDRYAMVTSKDEIVVSHQYKYGSIHDITRVRVLTNGVFECYDAKRKVAYTVSFVGSDGDLIMSLYPEITRF